MGTNGMIVLAMVGFVYERIDMFIDLAIAYALLNFIGTVAIGKYLERRRKENE
jgi:multicomponent Na+:H+ antiporter subunit F